MAHPISASAATPPATPIPTAVLIGSPPPEEAGAVDVTAGPVLLPVLLPDAAVVCSGAVSLPESLE